MTIPIGAAKTHESGGRLGLVALVLSVIAFVGSGVAATVFASVTAAAQLAGDGSWNGMSDQAEFGAILTAASGLLWLLAGLAGLALGIGAIVRKAGRAAGVAAVVVAVLAPGAGFTCFTVAALVAASA